MEEGEEREGEGEDEGRAGPKGGWGSEEGGGEVFEGDPDNNEDGEDGEVGAEDVPLVVARVLATTEGSAQREVGKTVGEPAYDTPAHYPSLLEPVSEVLVVWMGFCEEEGQLDAWSCGGAPSCLREPRLYALDPRT